MKTLLATFCICAGTAWAQPVVTVLDQPLGGKLAGTIPICKDASKVLCWVSKPFVSKDGTRLGSLRLPSADSRPVWAVYATFEGHVAKDGTLEELKVTTIGDDRTNIQSSISSRFGPPTALLNQADAYSAQWSLKDLQIESLCAGKCWVTFRSAAAQAALQKELAARKQKESARPVAP